MELLLATTLFTTPVDVVKEVLRLEAQQLVTFEGGPFTPAALDALFTVEAREAYQLVVGIGEARDAPLIDGDMIIGRQDYCDRLENLTIGEPEESDGGVAIAVSFQSQTCFADIDAAVREDVTDVVFHVVPDGETWRIADIQHELYGSLRGILAELTASGGVRPGPGSN